MNLLFGLGLALSLGTLAVSLLILVLARRSLAAVFLAVFLAGWGATGIHAPIVSALGGGIAMSAKVVWVLQGVSGAGVLAFAVVYPNVNVTRTRRAVLAGIAVATVAGCATMLLLPDVLWYDPATGARSMTPIVGTILGVVGGFLPIVLLGHRWLAALPGSYRTQIAWGILPISWWVLHDGLGYSIYPWMLGRHGPPDLGHPILDAFAWLNILAVVLVIALMAVAWSRILRGRGAADDRAMGMVLLYALPVTLVQVLFSWSPARGVPPISHLLLDYAVVPLAVYGVLRHRVVDIDLKLKRGIRHSTVAAAFLGVFLVAATVAQELLTDTLGWLVGGLAAGLLVFAVAPIQRVAERLSSAALPHASGDSGYLTYRRYQIYRAALEGTLRDGVLEPSETSALRSLRQELGITSDDHRALELDARARMGAVAA